MKTIIFDMYGVILKESKGNFIPFTYSHFPNTDKQFLVYQFTRAGLGEIDSNELMNSLGFSDPIFHMHDYIENHLTIDNDFFNFAEKYSSVYNFVLLSNDVLDWNRYIFEYFKIGKYFSHCIVSANVHTRKPDSKIYEMTLEKIGALPSDCIFIDNSVKNLRVANNFNIDTILFNRDKEEYDGKTVYSFQELDDLISHINI